jgi:hypothetical protein
MHSPIRQVIALKSNNRVIKIILVFNHFVGVFRFERECSGRALPMAK